MAQRIQVRRGTAADATTANPTLTAGEIGFETDTGKLKIGDGVTAWNSLAYFGAAADLTAHLDDPTDAHDASAVSFAPAGNLAATDVQAALVELDTEKAAKAAAGCVAWRSTAQALSTSTSTAISFDSETFDTDAFHDPAVNPTRLTVPAGKGGKYMVMGQVRYAASSTGIRVSAIRKNGTTDLSNTPGPNGGTSVVAVATQAIASLAAGDYVEMIAWQNSGGSLNTDVAASNVWTWLGLMRIGD